MVELSEEALRVWGSGVAFIDEGGGVGMRYSDAICPTCVRWWFG